MISICIFAGIVGMNHNFLKLHQSSVGIFFLEIFQRPMQDFERDEEVMLAEINSHPIFQSQREWGGGGFLSL